MISWPKAATELEKYYNYVKFKNKIQLGKKKKKKRKIFSRVPGKYKKLLNI